MHLLPCRRRHYSCPSLCLGQRCPQTRTNHRTKSCANSISVDAAWLGRNELRTAVFFACRQWRRCQNGSLTMVAAVAPVPYRGDARQRWSSGCNFGGNFQTPQLNSTVDISADAGGLRTCCCAVILQTMRIPLRGEPLEGADRWCILETHRLDFENVVLDERRQFPGNHMARRRRCAPTTCGRLTDCLRPSTTKGSTPTISTASCSAPDGCGCSCLFACRRQIDREPNNYIYQLDYERISGPQKWR